MGASGRHHHRPPVPSIGARRAQDDPREAVYQKVIDIIVDQGCKGALLFILEMVPGILHRHQGASMSYYDNWISELHQRAPQWAIQSWRLNTCVFGVPQDRERVYIVAINKDTVCLPPTPPVASLCGGVSSPTALAAFLHPRLPRHMEFTLNANMSSNLWAYKVIIKAELEHGPRGPFACISFDSDPSKDYGAWVQVDGMVDTFRTSNKHLWLLSLGEGEPSFSRSLHPMERFGLQGFPAWVGEGMSKRDVLEVTGNACSVPVVGSVLVQVLNVVDWSGVLWSSWPIMGWC